MKKFVSLMMALAMTMALLTGCGSSSSASTSAASGAASAAAGETYTLKMHMSVGATDPVYSAAEQFAAEVSEQSGGNITVELYPSSSLGNSADCLEGLSLRACDIVFDSISNMSSMTELANIEAAPYMYSGMDHYRAVWEGEVGQQLMQDTGDACGMVILASGLQGVRVMTTNKPVRSVADVKGLKLRVPTISIYMDTWDWLGASVTPLAGSEIFTAIQQNTVDGQENPYASSASLSLYEICDYVTETNHVYSTDGFIMDANFFNSLPADYQEILRTAAVNAGKFCTDAVIANAEADKQKFVDAGCEIIETDVSEWQAALDGFLEAKYPSLVQYAEMIAAVDPAK